MGMLVLGIEGEGFWSGMKDTYSETEISPSPGSNTYPAKNTWDADIAARFGLAIDRGLIYGKAGVVWGASTSLVTVAAPVLIAITSAPIR
jgi:hypothetical protein